MNTQGNKKAHPRKPITVELANLPDDALIAKHETRSIVGLGNSQTYALIKNGRFPAPVRLGVRCVRWRMVDLRRWLADPVNYRAA